MYILEAAFEYFISLLVAGAYLAKVTSEIGMSDSLTGILTSFVSLGCGFQIFAIFLANKRPVKRWVTSLHILNQLCFACIYVVPFFKLSRMSKTVLFVIFLLSGHIINNIVNSPKINWFMSLIDDNKRGRFTATKEIVSLISGMLVSFTAGWVIDHYTAMGNTRRAFVFCGISIFVLMLLHTFTLLSSKEKPAEQKEKMPVKKLLGELIHDKDLFKVILISVLWNIAHYAATPFYGTYQIKELGFSMTFISILSALSAICRSLCSRPMGLLADKRGFARMLNICFIIHAAGFAINIFTAPSNGKILYTSYQIFAAVSNAGINSGAINLIYDYVDKEKRTSALALKSTLAGIAGFLSTLIVSLLVHRVQANGNVFLGMHAYAQQVVSAIACILTLVIVVYLNTVIRKIKNKRGSAPEEAQEQESAAPQEQDA